MPCTINPIRKAKVKQSLMKGNSIREALKDGGYASGTQRGKNNSTTNPVVKVCVDEILRDLKEHDITVEYVLNNLKQDRELALSKGDYATATRCDELYGKYLAMFTEKVRHEGSITFSSEELARLQVIKNRITALEISN